MSEKKEAPKLSAALTGKYEAVGVLPGVIYTKKYGDVDLRTISLERAAKLVDEGFKYLRKVEKAPKAELPADGKK